ncbi:hypothetical protein ACFVFJ_48590, partial [Streptomyces sp. NPDC057717]
VAAFVDSHGHALLATAGSDRTVRIWDPATDFGCLTLPLGTAIHGIEAVGTDLALATSEGIAVIALAPTARA